MALFVALGGSGYAATQIGGGVKVKCFATRNHKRVSCYVVGSTGPGPRGPDGPRGPQGPKGDQGTPGTNGGNGPTTFTQEPAYTVDPGNPNNFLTPMGSPSPNRYLEEEYTIAEDSNAVTDSQSDVYMPLESPSRVGGSGTHISSVQFCINISPNSNSNYSGHSTVTVDKATVYELDEPKPAGGAGTGTPGGPPAYSPRTTLLQQSYTGQSTINDCLTATAATPQAVNPDGYLVLAVTLGLTTNGIIGGNFGTNYVQFGRVTTTFTP